MKLEDIPTIPSDNFTLGNSYKMTGYYFMVRIVDGELDLHYLLGWKPVGKSRETRLLSKNSTVAIMFEFEGTGDRTWFHGVEETSD